MDALLYVFKIENYGTKMKPELTLEQIEAINLPQAEMIANNQVGWDIFLSTTNEQVA